MVVDILGYIGALMVGVSLGLTGGGGSILALPVMVYAHKINPELARTYSLFIVGSGSLVGFIQNLFTKTVNFKIGFYFSIPSLIAIYLTSTFVYPAIPKVILETPDFYIDKPTFIMILFGIIMLITAIFMIKNGLNTNDDIIKKNNSKYNLIKSIIVGILVGVLTELIGSGGGFLIVPALVLFFNLSMKNAVGTSLLIILINSLTGIFFHINTENVDWNYLVLFSTISLLGIFIGTYASRFIKGSNLKVGFGIFILLMASFILLEKFI
ncbi:MAG: sulfite exporter TauE/SafE family protein [Flavobacteriales bacterium]|nr:sulfite exporter TauE/SafE family protein [Flavobacteriales bacterium]